MADCAISGRPYQANGFLRSLHEDDVALLEPFLEEIHCRSGDRLGVRRLRPHRIVFPLSLVVAIGLRSRESAVGLVGREGLVGWSALLSCDHLPQQATVLLDGGTALAMPARRMREACAASATLTLSLLNFVSGYIDQMSLTASAGSSASLRERLAAWLLMLHDRIEGDFIRITHRQLATQLGVRRASVTDLLHVLEGEAAVQCDRNVIFVRNRALLEERAAGAYRDGPRAAAPVLSTPAPLALQPA